MTTEEINKHDWRRASNCVRCLVSLKRETDVGVYCDDCAYHLQKKCRAMMYTMAGAEK